MLEIKNLTKEYDDLVIDNLSVTFPSTGMVIITGKSGCGKTMRKRLRNSKCLILPD